MNTTVIPIGNSKGIRLGKTILEKYQIKDVVELILKEDYIILKALPTPRKGWEESFQQMHENGDDRLLDIDFFEDENTDEWK